MGYFGEGGGAYPPKYGPGFQKISVSQLVKINALQIKENHNKNIFNLFITKIVYMRKAWEYGNFLEHLHRNKINPLQFVSKI